MSNYVRLDNGDVHMGSIDEELLNAIGKGLDVYVLELTNSHLYKVKRNHGGWEWEGPL